ncbi:MAG: PilW family protein [Rubrivivax sp.]
MNARRHLNAPKRFVARSARGFTLIEILVALALGVLILLALTILFSRNTSNHAELERTTRQIESARFSIDVMAEDLMHAGFYGEFDPDTLTAAPSPPAPPAERYAVPAAYQRPDPCAIAPTAQGWTTHDLPPPPDDRIQIPVPVQGIAAGAAVGCLANRVAGTEAIVVRHAETGAPTTLAAGNSNNLYIQIARCGLDVPRVRAAAVPSGMLNLRLFDCVTVNDVLRRLTQRSYYIADCNDCLANDGIPTLKRVEMIDGALRTMSVAEGVENLQVEYGVDTDGDGHPDDFLTTAGVEALPLNLPVVNDQWQYVVSVRLHLLTRSTQPTAGFSDTRTYQLGLGVAIVPPADGNKRTLMTTTVRLVNVGGRRE